MEHSKRYPGRPPKPDEDKASSVVHMRVTRKDKARWTATSQREGMKLTAWITQVLNENSSFDGE